MDWTCVVPIDDRYASRHSPETNLQHADADDAKCDTQANMFANASVVDCTDTDGDSITFKLENRHINY